MTCLPPHGSTADHRTADRLGAARRGGGSRTATRRPKTTHGGVQYTWLPDHDRVTVKGWVALVASVLGVYDPIIDEATNIPRLHPIVNISDLGGEWGEGSGSELSEAV